MRNTFFFYSLFIPSLITLQNHHVLPCLSKPPPFQDITDITSKTQSTSYRGEAVTRRQMMEILSSMESLMIRARYHTVQVEGV